MQAHWKKGKKTEMYNTPYIIALYCRQRREKYCDLSTEGNIFAIIVLDTVPEIDLNHFSHRKIYIWIKRHIDYWEDLEIQFYIYINVWLIFYSLLDNSIITTIQQIGNAFNDIFIFIIEWHLPQSCYLLNVSNSEHNSKMRFSSKMTHAIH